ERMTDAAGQYQMKMDFGAQQEAELQKRAADEKKRLKEERARKKVLEKRSRSKSEVAAKLRDEEWEKFKQEVETKRKSPASPEAEEPTQSQEASPESETNPENLASRENTSRTLNSPENKTETLATSENHREPLASPENNSETFTPTENTPESLDSPENTTQTDDLYKDTPETTDPSESVSEPAATIEPPKQARTIGPSRKLLGALLIAALVIIGIWMFAESDVTTEMPMASPETQKTENQKMESPIAERPNAGPSTAASPSSDSSPPGTLNEEPRNTDRETENAPIRDSAQNQKATSNLSVGDTHAEGIVFTVDTLNGKGKIAYTKDFGPIPWKDAAEASSQLGEGWRLPTMEELEKMYQTIGQGGTEKGEFADELYWSATPFDDNQARLFRFSDGNASFHYNNGVPYRKFLARPVRDFKR
ncbi:MAG: hypothetical protein WA913_03905, partial [Pricia sp.]